MPISRGAAASAGTARNRNGYRNMEVVPHNTTVPTAAATSWGSASRMGWAAATAEQPHTAAPVLMSVVSLSPRPRRRPSERPRNRVENNT
eukprot:scaffold34877_cov90-Isochrysis_galbana.AAC.1